MIAGADRWIRWTTIGCVAFLALIAGTMSYLPMHALVARHGQPGAAMPVGPASASTAELRLVRPPQLGQGNRNRAGADLQRRAWQWALAHRASGGSLPSGAAIAAAHGRQERWGRLVKKAGQAGALGPASGELGQTTATGAKSAL
jgi:hypothetical protein